VHSSLKLHSVSVGLFLVTSLVLAGCRQKLESDSKALDGRPLGTAPKIVLGAPIAGSGKSLKILAVFHDDSGVANLVDLFIVTNTAQRGVDGTAGCAIWCRRGSGDVYLLNDAGNDWFGPRKLRSNGTLTNSQCTVTLDETQLTEVNGNAQWDVSVAFSKKFAGPKNIYARAINQQKQESNSDQLGTWDVTDR
jgi:hypothetical protein